MFTGFAAGCNAMARGAIFYKAGVVDCRAFKRQRAFMAYAAIFRGHHMIGYLVLAGGFYPIVAKSTGAKCLRMQGCKIGSDIRLFPIRKTDTRGCGMTNLAHIAGWNMRGGFGSCANSRDVARHAFVYNCKHGMHAFRRNPYRHVMAQVTGCSGRNMISGLRSCGQSLHLARTLI